MSTTKSEFTGGCACAGLRYVLTQAPQNSIICHCASCRKVAAAPVVPWITVQTNHFRLSGTTAETYESSEKVKRVFCKLCATHLIYSNDDRPGEIDITTCSLDDPDQFPPSHHSWLSDDLKWIEFGDALPKHPEFNSGSA
jgi:hypothetical protein